MQQTVQRSVTLQGIGLHTGRTIALTAHPAPVDHGIVFRRSDLAGNDMIPALWNYVVDTRLCTMIGNEAGATVATIEHIMAALRGLEIDNAVIEVNGPEVPSMDGSSAPFISILRRAGISGQDAPRRMLKILKKVEIRDESGKGFARLSPSDSCAFAGEIDFAHPLIGRQSYETRLVNGNFAHELASTRSFVMLQDVEALRAAGLIKGGSMENAVVLNDASVLNPGGLRFENEFIRHKLLDAVGDTYLAGAPILGRYEGARIGHALNNRLLHAVFADEDAYAFITDEEVDMMLPICADDRIAAYA